MTSKVLTRSTCDRCGMEEEREHGEGDLPPVEWAALRFDRRLKGAGWTNSRLLWQGILCPPCQDLIIGELFAAKAVNAAQKVT